MYGKHAPGRVLTRGYGEAHRALRHVDAGGGVVALEALSLTEYLAAGADETARRLVSPGIDTLLREDRRQGGALSSTLRAYADCDLDVRRTASRLIVHPNTVHHRLRRVQALTGRNPRRFAELAELTAALRLLGSEEAEGGAQPQPRKKPRAPLRFLSQAGDGATRPGPIFSAAAVRLPRCHTHWVPGEPSLTGGCLCGGVRFELSEPATAAGYCHCTRCQRRTGSGSSAQARIDGRTFRLVKGDELVQAWRHPDGGFEKCFCRNCGAHLFSRDPDDPTQMSVRLPAFDGDPGVRPSWRAHVESAAVWEPIPDDGLERHEGSRPR